MKAYSNFKRKIHQIDQNSYFFSYSPPEPNNKKNYKPSKINWKLQLLKKKRPPVLKNRWKVSERESIALLKRGKN